MPDCTDLAPTNGSDFVPTLCWLYVFLFVSMMTSQKALWGMWDTIRKPKTKVLILLLLMQVVKGALDTDIFNQQWRYFLCAPHNATFYKPLLRLTGNFAVFEWVFIVNDCHRHDFSPIKFEIVGESSHTNVATFVQINISGRGKAGGWH